MSDKLVIVSVGEEPSATAALRAAGAAVEVVASADAAAALAAQRSVSLVIGPPAQVFDAADRTLAVQARANAQTLRAAELEVLARLARAASHRDDNTAEHTQRVAATAARLAGALDATAEEVDLIRVAAPLHDVGKIAIPDEILLKPGRLTESEFEVVRTHSAIGAAILTGSSFPAVRMAETIARSHHERWDGTGYPDGLAGEAIPLPARAVAVADVFDVLTHERPYRESSSPDEARAELRRAAGSQFDPAAVEAFLAI